MKELLRTWGIGEVDSISPTSTGGGKTWIVTSARGSFVLKASDLARAEREHKALRRLSSTQVPIALPISTLEGASHATDGDGRICCLYPKLPGHVVTEHFDGDARERARRFGRAIGLLHEGFRQTADVDEYPRMDLVEHVEDWAIPRIQGAGAVIEAAAVEQVWRDAAVGLSSVYGDLPQQLIHRDAHTSNMLFSKGRLTGIVDFEMVRRGPRVFDVCYCASSILVEGIDDPGNGKLCADLSRSLVGGYEEASPLAAPEHSAMFGILVAIGLLFLAYWIERSEAHAARSTERLLNWLVVNREALDV